MVDLLITQEMVRGDSMSWGSADAWFERSRELIRERDIERLRAEQAERDLASSAARAVEAERQLENGGVPQEVVQRLSDQAEEMQVLKDSLARSRSEGETAAARADSLAGVATASSDSLERQADVAALLESLDQAIAERGGDGSGDAERVLEQAARAGRLSDSLSVARQVVAALDRELQDARDVLPDDAASVVDSLRAARMQADALRDRTTQAEQERDDALGRANYLQTPVRPNAPGHRDRSATMLARSGR